MPRDETRRDKHHWRRHRFALLCYGFALLDLLFSSALLPGSMTDFLIDRPPSSHAPGPLMSLSLPFIYSRETSTRQMQTYCHRDYCSLTTTGSATSPRARPCRNLEYETSIIYLSIYLRVHLEEGEFYTHSSVHLSIYYFLLSFILEKKGKGYARTRQGLLTQREGLAMAVGGAMLCYLHGTNNLFSLFILALLCFIYMWGDLMIFPRLPTNHTWPTLTEQGSNAFLISHLLFRHVLRWVVVRTFGTTMCGRTYVPLLLHEDAVARKRRERRGSQCIYMSVCWERHSTVFGFLVGSPFPVALCNFLYHSLVYFSYR